MSRSVQRAAAILDSLSTAPSTVVDLAEVFGVHRTTMFRELKSLESVGFLRRNSQGKYILGTKLISLAQQALEDLDLREISQECVTKLHETVGNTVHLAALIDSSIVYVDKREDASSVRMYSRVGKAVLPQCTGVGKVILAHLDSRSRDAVLKDATWERYTSTTLTSRDELDAQLAEIVSRGWGIDNGEFEDFVNCVAVPIIASSGVVGALSVTSLRMIENLDSLSGYIPLMQDTAASIAQRVG